jgi:membrane protein DedA with SNARE-associated domain
MKKERLRIIIVFITSLIAILLVSFTVGREWYEGKSQSLWSFGAIHFAGYLFFLLMPVEMAFIYYLPAFNDLILILIALATACVAQMVDYLIGLWVRATIIQNFVGPKQLRKAEKYIRKYGDLTIFVFNLFPLSSSVISLVAGMLKYRFSHFILVSLGGLIIKYVVLSLAFRPVF